MQNYKLISIDSNGRVFIDNNNDDLPETECHFEMPKEISVQYDEIIGNKDFNFGEVGLSGLIGKVHYQDDELNAWMKTSEEYPGFYWAVGQGSTWMAGIEILKDNYRLYGHARDTALKLFSALNRELVYGDDWEKNAIVSLKCCNDRAGIAHHIILTLDGEDKYMLPYKAKSYGCFPVPYGEIDMPLRADFLVWIKSLSPDHNWFEKMAVALTETDSLSTPVYAAVSFVNDEVEFIGPDVSPFNKESHVL